MIEDFLKYLVVEKRYSKHTVLAYQKDLLSFFDFHKNIHFAEIDRGHVRFWVIDMAENGLEETSIKRKVSAVKSYFKFKLLKKQVSINPAVGVPTPKVKKRLPNFIPEKDLDKDSTEAIAENLDLRSKCIIELFYQTGIRLSELIELKKSNVRKNEIKVIGKRSKERIIPISNQLGELLNEYRIYSSEKYNEHNSNKFFLTDKGAELYPNFVYRLVKKYINAISTIEKKSPHVLRHSFATHMLNNGAEIESIKELLGHSSLAATQVYTHNSISRLKKVYQKSHPRGN